VCVPMRSLKNSRNQKMIRVKVLLAQLRDAKAANPEKFSNPEAINEFLSKMARLFLLEKRSTDRLVQTVRDVIELWPNEWDKNNFLEGLRKLGVQ